MNHKIKSVLYRIDHFLGSDLAENSIMQTITIAVSAILIAAGLVTAPGLINNARDNNAKTDLANIAFGQEFALANVGHYFQYITPADELAATGQNVGNNLMEGIAVNGFATSVVKADGGLKFTLSGSVTSHKSSICSAVNFYVLKAKSSSGKWFYRGSGSSITTMNFNSIVVPPEVMSACPTIVANFAETAPNGGGGVVVTPPGDDDGGGDDGGSFVCWNEDPWASASDDGYLKGRIDIAAGNPYSPGVLNPVLDPRCDFQYKEAYDGAYFNTGFIQFYNGGMDNIGIPNECMAYEVKHGNFIRSSAYDEGANAAYSTHESGFPNRVVDYAQLSAHPIGGIGSFPASCDEFFFLGYDQVLMDNGW